MDSGLELVAVDFCMSGIVIRILRLIECDYVCVCVWTLIVLLWLVVFVGHVHESKSSF